MKIIYYVAMSVDGFLATADGSVDWLESFSSDGQDYGYADFFASIDALVMGRKTYDQILQFGEWPYGEKATWVLTKGEIETTVNSVQSFSGSPCELVNLLSAKHKKAWLVGGGALANSFAEENLIDEYLLFVMPCLLGQGIGLFGSNSAAKPTSISHPSISNLELMSSQSYDNGVVKLHYATEDKS